MNFGEKLKVIRKSLNISQQEFADRLGTTKQAISRYENSEREPNLKTAKTFSDKLGIDIVLLADDEIYLPVGERIRQERISQGYSSSQFSKLIGISESRLNQLENEELYPTVLELSRFSRILCCDTDWLLSLTWKTNRTVPGLTESEQWLISFFRSLPSQEQEKMLKTVPILFSDPEKKSADAG